MPLDLVVDNLYLSDLAYAADATRLDAADIWHVLSVGCDVQAATGFVRSERAVRYLALPDVRDEPEDNLMRLFPVLLTFLYEAATASSGRKNVVVHCVHGQSRSAATIVAFLSSPLRAQATHAAHAAHVWRTTASTDAHAHAPAHALGHEDAESTMSLDQALGFLKRRVSRICINPGFLSQLHLYYHRHLFPAEYAMVMSMEGPDGRRSPGESGEDGVLPSETRVDASGTGGGGGEGWGSGAVYVLQCVACGQALLHARRESRACTAHLPVPTRGDDDAVCAVAVAVAGTPPWSEGVVAATAAATGEHQHQELPDPDLRQPDLCQQILSPRVGSAALLEKHLDDYYRGYTSPLEWERHMVRLAVPLDPAPTKKGTKGRKAKATRGGDAAMTAAVVTESVDASLALYAHPDGWVHAQRHARAAQAQAVAGGGGGGEWALCCPNTHCATPVGVYRKGGLRVCDGFLKTYLAALWLRTTRWEFM